MAHRPSPRARLRARLASLAALAFAAVAGPATLAGCTHRPPAGCDAAGPDTACTTEGAVRGVREGDLVAFKGLPYAAPPVGALRWRAPEPPRPWTGVRDASRFGPVCPQLSGSEVTGDENCLTLNVWRPASPSPTPRPVMVFFTGGGNHGFSGQGAPVFGGVQYNGRRLAPEGVVFVSFNYRLGALGFLAHPALDADRPERVSGNYGSLDQVAMLRWLKRNAASFGGDPERVFVFGTSAGGGNICALMTAPAARGLFHGAAMQSSVPTGCELPTLAQARQGTGALVAQTLGCSGPDAAACLRGRSAAEVVRAVPGTFGVLPRLYGPVVDGQLIPRQPIDAIRAGAHQPMPVIVGNSTLETQQFVGGLGPVENDAAYRAAVARVFGPAQADRVVQAYPASAHPTPRDALVRLTTDALFTCQSRRVARALAAAQREPVYRYLFDHALENDPVHKALGAVHTVEHPFFFAWEGAYRPTEGDLAVQRRLVSQWTELATQGRIAGERWSVVGPADAYQRVSAEPAARATLTGDGGAKCDFWDTVPLPSPHL